MGLPLIASQFLATQEREHCSWFLLESGDSLNFDVKPHGLSEVGRRRRWWWYSPALQWSRRTQSWTHKEVRKELQRCLLHLF